MFKPSSKIFFTDRSKAVLLLRIICYLCLVFVMLSHLFIAAFWSPAGKGLTSWLSSVMFNCVCHFLMWYPESGVVLDCVDF